MNEDKKLNDETLEKVAGGTGEDLKTCYNCTNYGSSKCPYHEDPFIILDIVQGRRNVCSNFDSLLATL